MFVYCDKCDYDSGDKETLDELRQKVKDDGGSFGNGKSVCPKCNAKDTLGVD